MNALRKSEIDLGEMMRAKLSGFVSTLRDNGFVIGLAEMRDALGVMSSASAARPSRTVLQSPFGLAEVRRDLRRLLDRSWHEICDPHVGRAA